MDLQTAAAPHAERFLPLDVREPVTSPEAWLEYPLQARMVEAAAARAASRIETIAPHSAISQFVRWAGSAQNPLRDSWLHLCSITQVARLSLVLYKGIGEREDAEALAMAAVPMLEYLLFEVVSDNLGMTPGDPATYAAEHRSRRELAAAFHDVMAECLADPCADPATLLAPYSEDAKRISVFDGSLNPALLRRVVAVYTSRPGRPSEADLDRSLLPLLVANVESCRDLIRLARGPMGDIVREGFINRYRAANVVMDERLPLSRRLAPAADTVNVMSVLGWYLATMSQVLGVDVAASCTGGNEMVEALQLAAVMVRILNDIGLPLLTNVNARADMARALTAQARLSSSTRTVLHNTALQLGSPLTRIRKDLEHGEHNICLTGLPERAGKAVPRLIAEMDYLAGVYAHSRRLLDAVTWQLNDSVGDDAPSRILLRFVRFHEKLYSNPYEGCSGEYTG